MKVKINLNETVKVRLTQFGKDIYIHQYDELINKYPLLKISHPEIKVDENGYSKFILWQFINLYGPYMTIGEPEVIKPLEIIYEEEGGVKDFERKMDFNKGKITRNRLGIMV